MTARNWWLDWHFSSKVWLRKEAKIKASAPKWCQLKPPLVSSRTVPWAFCSCVTRKKAKDVTCSIQTLANCSNAQAEKGNYSGSITCTSSDLEKNCLSFPAMQSQRLFNPLIHLHPPNQHQPVWGTALSWLQQLTGWRRDIHHLHDSTAL